MPMDLKPTRARYLKDANEVSHPPVIWSFKCLIVLRSVTIVIILTDFAILSDHGPSTFIIIYPHVRYVRWLLHLHCHGFSMTP